MMNRSAIVAGMGAPVECARCGGIYDLQAVVRIARYSDCDVWVCPHCNATMDNRGNGVGPTGLVNYFVLDENGFRPREYLFDGDAPYRA